jgi:autotransporter-associated beta strand protein
MTTNNANQHDHDASIGEQNIERLLRVGYDPVTLQPGYASAVKRAMLAAAAGRRAKANERTRAWPVGRVLSWSLAAAAMAALAVGLLMQSGAPKSTPAGNGGDGLAATSRPRSAGATWPAWLASGDGYGLTPGAAVAAPVARPVDVGAVIETKAFERRRVTLPDGSVAFVNQNTKLTVDSARRLSLAKGEVFVEVAHQVGADGQGLAKFVVATPNRQVTALGTKFDVRTDDTTTHVAVTQGKVQVSGHDELLYAGRQLSGGRDAAGDKVTAIPRATAMLGWTEDLVAAAQSPLVPESDYDGGAIVAIDPNGQECRLSLRKYNIDVHIEDGFARTTIDQTYFNHLASRSEGTFYFPLPADASISRLAMYVNGQLMEGGMAEREQARYVYEDILNTRRDPALLEWVDGSTFKMRVFPLEGRQEKRIILSYAQRLDSLYGQTHYRFPGGHNMPLIGQWSFHARVVDGAQCQWSSPTHQLQSAPKGADLLLDAQAANVRPNADVVLDMADVDPVSAAVEYERFASKVFEGSRYLMLRFRPELRTDADQASAARPARQWVFLFETSGDRQPLLARAQIEVVKTVLANAQGDDSFDVVLAGTHTQTLAPSPLPVTSENIAGAVKFMEKAHLIGALDMEGAFAAAKGLLVASAAGGPSAVPEQAGKPVPREPYLVQVGSGIAVLGERATDKLVGMLPAGTRYVGVAVGKRWGRSFMQEAAARTGGYFTQINPDENIDWRAFDTVATLDTPRLLGMKVVGDDQQEFLTFNNSVAAGEEITAVARLDEKAGLPAFVTITGTLDGKEYSRRVSVANVAQDADYLPRFWAKLEIDRLVNADGAANHDKIVELSKSMYVMSPFTSLLVLENDDMYKQYKVDRGRKDHWAMYAAPATIPVVANEPVTTTTGTNAAEKPSPETVLGTVNFRIPSPLLCWPGQVYNYAGGTLTASQLLSGNYPLAGYYVNWDSGGPIRYSGSTIINAGASVSTSWGDSNWQNGADNWNFQNSASLNGRFIDGHDGYTNGLWNIGRDGATVDGTILRANSGLASFTLNGGSLSVSGGGLTFGSGPVMLTSGIGNGTMSINGVLTDPRLTFSSGSSGSYMLGGSGGLTKIGTGNLILTNGNSYSGAVSFDAGAYSSTVVNGGTLDINGDSLRLSGSPFGDRGLTSIGHEWAGRGEERRGQALGQALPGGKFKDKQPRRLPSDYWVANDSLGDLGEDFQSARHDRDSRGWMYQPAGAAASMLYQPPTLNGDRRGFSDLLAFAPGMNTNWVDVQAVVEADAKLPAVPTGKITDKAKAMLEKARQAAWQKVAWADDKGQEAFALTVDGQGRYAYERTTDLGLKEQVICDGKWVFHVYPELGVGSQRAVNRYSRAEARSMAPWLVGAVEDYLRGADVREIDERTVAISPIGAEDAKGADGKPAVYAQARLVFGADGKMVERQLVEMPTGKLLARRTFDAGAITWFDGAGKEVAKLKLTVTAAARPALAPDEEKVVLLPMPYRPVQGIIRGFGDRFANNGHYADMPTADALALLSAAVGGRDWALASNLVGQRFFRNDDHRVGFYVLLLAVNAGNAQWDRHTEIAMQDGKGSVRFEPSHNGQLTPLAQYIAQELDLSRGVPGAGAIIGTPDDGFIWSLSAAQYYLDPTHADSPAARQAGVREFVVKCKSPALAWPVFAAAVAADRGGANAKAWVAAAGRFDHTPLEYCARYECARAAMGGNPAQAREMFTALFQDTVKQGVLPAIDANFYSALGDTVANGAGTYFAKLMRETAAMLVEKQARPAVVALAVACRQVGDTTTADELVTAALAGVDKNQSAGVQLAAAEYYNHAGDWNRADAVLTNLLADERAAKTAWVWRLAADVAAKRNRLASSVQRSEMAMELEFAELPDVVNIQAVRNEYAGLLARYEQLAQSSATAEGEAPKELVSKIIRSADRWRALDPDANGPCLAAAKALQALSSRELAWEYLTTPLAAKPNEAAPWTALAVNLRGQGELDLAQRAYASAFEAEGTNAQILWDRAQVLQQLGRSDEAQALVTRVATGPWPRQYNAIQQQARQGIQK